MAEVEHQLHLDDWRDVEGTSSASGNPENWSAYSRQATGPWVAVSEAIPATPGDTVRLTTGPATDWMGDSLPQNPLIVAGDDITAGDSEPVAGPDALILASGDGPGEILADALPADLPGPVYAAVWLSSGVEGGLAGPTAYVTEGEPPDPDPDPEPWVEVAGSVITITDAPASTEYTLETEDEQHQHTLTTDGHGAGSFDAAEWGLPPGEHMVTITGPYLAEAVLVSIEPDPDPDPGDDYLDELAARLAPRVAAYVGRRDDAVATETAEGQVPIVAEFVRGYTRGNGWQGYRPAAPLRAVIVSATARLVLNPEQVRQYSSGDYSETGPLLTGFTLAERHVLDRYRRRWA